MLTKNGISIITCGLAGSQKMNSSTAMINDPTKYLWLKSPSGKWICSYVDNYAHEEEFVAGSSDNPFEYSENSRTVTNTEYLLQNNSDIANYGNRNLYGNFCNYTLILGTSTTSPTVDDYKLVNCETRYIRKQESMSFDSKNLQCQVSLIIQPTADITINEIGCYVRCNTGETGYEAEKNYNCNNLSLIDRKVLASPLTISNGTLTTITYTVDFRNINEATV